MTPKNIPIKQAQFIQTFQIFLSKYEFKYTLATIYPFYQIPSSYEPAGPLMIVFDTLTPTFDENSAKTCDTDILAADSWAWDDLKKYV